MSIAITAAPTDSAPNSSAPASDRSAREKAWKAEIHTPEADYNANVPVDAIERDPANRIPSDAAVAELANAIKAVGLLQPIVLRALDGGKYRIIAGEHRWRAFQLLSRKTIPARIYKNEDDLSSARKALLENNAREALTPIERAKRFHQLTELGMKQKEIGELAGGLSQPVVANTLRLLELPETVQRMIVNRELSEAHGVTLVRFAKWPRVCACIARMAYEHGYSSKDLSSDGFPFAGQCLQEGLVEKIQIKDRYYSDGAVYKLPRHFGSHRDFIVEEYYAYYIVPEDAKDNVWAPEKAKQDAERAALAAAEAKREAEKAAKNGGKSKEALERAKTIAKNKARRAENAAALAAALEKLKRTPAPTALLVAILTKEALKGSYGSKRIEEGAASVGVSLPKGAVTAGSYGLNKIELLRKMDVMELTRVAVAVLITREIEYANRNAWDLPENVEAVMNESVKSAKKGSK